MILNRHYSHSSCDDFLCHSGGKCDEFYVIVTLNETSIVSSNVTLVLVTFSVTVMSMELFSGRSSTPAGSLLTSKLEIGRGCGQVVGVPAFLYDDLSSNPAKVNNFICNLFEKTESNQKEAEDGPF